MDEHMIDLFLADNARYLPKEKNQELREKLLDADPTRFQAATQVVLKNPSVMVLLSLFLGGFGVDRFVFGETGMGFLKLLTFGMFGILTVIDWFLTPNKTKELNYSSILRLL